VTLFALNDKLFFENKEFKLPLGINVAQRVREIITHAFGLSIWSEHSQLHSTTEAGLLVYVTLKSEELVVRHLFVDSPPL
jgi:hypothetical protein